jgi:SAM-dependent methyltransferase
MTDTQNTPTIDESRVEAFVGQLMTDFAGAGTTAMTVIGDRLGLYRAMTGAGPLTAEKLAAATGLHPRLVAEWLRQQAVSGYLTADGDTFELPMEHALALSVVDSPVYVIGAADVITGTYLTFDKLEAAFRGDGGIELAEMPGCTFHGIERFFRTAYVNQLVQTWFPAVPGLLDKLAAGAKVADVGCGHGFATRLIAQTWPSATVRGYDFHQPSIATARAQSVEAGGPANVSFHVADSGDLASRPEGPFDVVLYFDSLHDLGNPPAALRAAYDSLADGGILVAVEPWSADRFTDMIGNPMARTNYAASVALCTPGSLSQPGAYGLGTQGGPAQRVELIAGAGFADARVAADTGFNLVLTGTKAAR